MGKQSFSKKRKGTINITPGSSLLPIFEVDENGVLNIARENIVGLYPFNKILARDTSSDKAEAFTFFKYIYLMWDINSELDGIQDMDERHRKALILCELDPEWIPDTLVLKGKKAYEDIYVLLNPQVLLFRTLKRGLRSTDKVINVLIETIERNLEKQLKSLTENPDVAVEIGSLTTHISTLNNLAGSLPNTIASIESVFNSIKANDVLNENARNPREEPDYAAKQFGSLRDDDDQTVVLDMILVKGDKPGNSTTELVNKLKGDRVNNE